MSSEKKMTPAEEYEFYSDPRNREPAGPMVRRNRRLADPVPVRFPPELLQEIRERAAQEDRSISSWLRRAAEHELRHPA